MKALSPCALVAFSLYSLFSSRTWITNVAKTDLQVAHAPEQTIDEDGDRLAPRPPLDRESRPCDVLSRESATSLWFRHLDKIVIASQLRIDSDHKLEKITSDVLRLITPRLPTSIKSIPQDSAAIDRIWDKAVARYQYLVMKEGPHSEPPPPPLKIVVLGGSVTRGVNCYTGITRLWMERCAWPTQLEQFLNNLARLSSTNTTSNEEKWVEVHTLAAGGANTEIGTLVLRYDALPEEARNPDIVINAFSTNDMHAHTIANAEAGNITLADKILDMGQDFIRTLYQKCQEEPPILFWVDDYLGNEQRELLATTALSKSIGTLASYYGFGFLSYADVVRQWVYGDTTETMFSPSGWYKDRARAEMLREIHPGFVMHLTTSWIVAYNLLNMVTTQCNLHSMELTPAAAQTGRFLSANKSGMIDDFSLGGRSFRAPRPRPAGLPPKLTRNLTLDEVSDRWQQESPQAECSNATCSFSWVSGLPRKKPKQIRNLFKEFLVQPATWELQEDHGKLGWMPASPVNNPVMTMQFSFDPKQPSLQSITLFFMKSYGPKWVGSEATVQIATKDVDGWKPVASQILTGTHDKNTSETYSETMRLERPVNTATSPLRIAIRLTGGSTFKLMGVAVCSQAFLTA
jgi:hypothetical protein